MNVIKGSTLKKFYESRGRADSKQPLLAWYREIKSRDWNNFNELRTRYRSADMVGNNRMVFNICGNKYRLVVAFSFTVNRCYIKWIGTHAEYDDIDVTTIDYNG